MVTVLPWYSSPRRSLTVTRLVAFDPRRRTSQRSGSPDTHGCRRRRTATLAVGSRSPVVVELDDVLAGVRYRVDGNAGGALRHGELLVRRWHRLCRRRSGACDGRENDNRDDHDCRQRTRGRTLGHSLSESPRVILCYRRVSGAITLLSGLKRPKTRFTGVGASVTVTPAILAETASLGGESPRTSSV